MFATADLDDVSLRWIIDRVKTFGNKWSGVSEEIGKSILNPAYIQVEKPLNDDEKGIMNHHMKELNESQQGAFEKVIKYPFSLCQGGTGKSYLILNLIQYLLRSNQ